MIQFDGDRLKLHFRQFGTREYLLFLKAKSLPEYGVTFHAEDETYTIDAPARFAPLLGVDAPRIEDQGFLPLPEFLFDDQRSIVPMALNAKRFACWSGCGLGKTLIELEFGRQVMHKTGGRFLLFTLNDLVPQIIEEAATFYGDALPLHRIRSREELKEWAAGRVEGPKFGITNYEKMNHKTGDQVVNELRHLAGVGLDESSRLKGGGGKQKWALIKSCKGIEYKLSCTATPAPNDTIEFASQASFLEKMRSDTDIIWTYFVRDKKSHRWTVKAHARKAFFEFMAAWSIYVNNPKTYGWRIDHPDIPEPEFVRHTIEPTRAQLDAAAALLSSQVGQQNALADRSTNAIERNKLAQIARGFMYRRGGKVRGFDRIESRKPAAVADLVKQDLADDRQVLVWTVFDAESQIICEQLRAVPHALLTGKTKPQDRIAILERFRHGSVPVLVSRASMLGWGMNFQHVGSMIFSGWTDSFEAYYQAIRRAFRHGQTKRLRVHLPCIDDLEGDMLENIFAKETKHLDAISEMEANYATAYGMLAA